VRIFEHNFGEGKAKNVQAAVARQKSRNWQEKKIKMPQNQQKN